MIWRTLLLVFCSLCLPGLCQESEPISVVIGSGGLTITVDGTLDFGARMLTGVDQVYPAVSAPQIQLVDARGTGQGWVVKVEASDFVSGAHQLPANFLSYTANGGSLTTIYGLPVGGGGPLETGLSGSLDSEIQVVTAGIDAGMGTYRWVPRADSFQLTIPGVSRAGIYQATLTFSIASGL